MEYFQGDTVRLKATFPDFDGQLFDPTNLRVRIFDARWQQIGQDIVADIARLEQGVFICPYTLPVGQTLVFYEWSGLDAAGRPVVCAATIEPIRARRSGA